MRIGPRYDVTCVSIASLSGHLISWSDEVRYLGIYITSSRVAYLNVRFHMPNVTFMKLQMRSSAK